MESSTQSDYAIGWNDGYRRATDEASQRMERLRDLLERTEADAREHQHLARLSVREIRAVLETDSKEKVASSDDDLAVATRRLTELMADRVPTDYERGPYFDFDAEPLRPVRGRRVTEDDTDW